MISIPSLFFRKLKQSLLILFLCGCYMVNGQVLVNISAKYGSQMVQPDTYYPCSSKDSVTFSMLKWYFSNIRCYRHDTLVYTEPQSYHLVDAFKQEGKHFNIPIGSNIPFDEVRCLIGIDSITSVSGVFGGDLDPIHEMYWTWQSGFVHFKIEGQCSLIHQKHGEFQYHLGGYSAPFPAIPELSFPASNNRELGIEIHLDKFIQLQNLFHKPQLMIPGVQAAALLKDISQQCFNSIP